MRSSAGDLPVQQGRMNEDGPNSPMSTTSTPSSPERRRRSKLTVEGKESAREVRQKRACLRCRMLKVKCSPEDPCTPCLTSAVRGRERKVLSFCYCVRTQLTDINIFQSNQYSLVTVHAKMEALDELTARQETQPGFDLDQTVRRAVEWIIDKDMQTGDEHRSMIAMLTSRPFTDAIQGSLDAEIIQNFRRFLLSSSLAHTGWIDTRGTHRLSWSDLHLISHVTGSNLVTRLDRALGPQTISTYSRRTLQALFLVVFGSILGVGYSTQLTGSPDFPIELLSQELQHSPTLWFVMRRHLCEMLAHYLIFLGSALGHKLDTATEQLIVERAIQKWNRPENYFWAHRVVAGEEQSRAAASKGAADDYFNESRPSQLYAQVAMSCPELMRPELPASGADLAPLKRRFTLDDVPDLPATGNSPVDSTMQGEDISTIEARVDAGPARKRRTFLVVGPSDGYQMYSKFRSRNEDGRPGFVV